MRPLKTQFTKDGWDFTQVKRRGNIAVYEQRRPGAAEPAAWEVVVIREGRPHPQDPDQSDKERYPSSEEWGKMGWTFLTLEAALGRALMLAEVAK